MYRVYTEDTPHIDARHVALDLLARHGIAGATLYNALGLYKGQAEASLVIETDGAGPTHGTDTIGSRAAVYSFAEDLKAALGQEAIGIVETRDAFTLL